MRHWIIFALVAIVAAGVGAAAALYFAFPNQVQLVGGETRSELLSLNAPPGALTTEANAAYKGAAAPAAAAGAARGLSPAQKPGLGCRSDTVATHGSIDIIGPVAHVALSGKL